MFLFESHAARQVFLSRVALSHPWRYRSLPKARTLVTSSSISDADDRSILISLRNCSIRPHLPHDSYALKGPPIALQGVNWTLRKGENWVCMGPNGCGKSTFVRALVGKATIVRGEMRSKVKTSACVSFADHERLKAVTDYMASHGADMEEEGLTVSSLMKDSRLGTAQESAETEALVEEFVDYKSLWKRNLDSLSSGELRRILILHALFGRKQQVELLVLDEAFDFIDERRRDLLARLLNVVAAKNPDTRIVLVSHREQDLAKLTFLTNRLTFPGRASVGEGGESSQAVLSSCMEKEVLGAVSHKTVQERNDFVEEVRALVVRSLELRRTFDQQHSSNSNERSNGPVVAIHNATLSYSEDEPPVLKNATLVVHKGERVLLCGPSGSGKSLLLSLVTGENPQCYSNDVKVFGRALGDEDTLESRRKVLGHFSPSMSQSRFLYNRQKPALEVVLNGLVQSFDLEGKEHETHRQLARDWANLFLKGVGSSADQPYQTLSQGQRTAVLLARALISAPRLLLLDEPFTSLDFHTRDRLKETIQCVLQCNPDCAVIATSHYPMDDFPYFENKLMLVRPASEQTFRLARMRSSTAAGAFGK